MTITILCTFRLGAYAQARALRREHYEFLAREMGNIVEGGPLIGDDGLPAAMLMVVERNSVEEAKDFISNEPYTHAGLFESVLIRPWRRVLPEPNPGFVHDELQKERALSGLTS